MTSLDPTIRDGIQEGSPNPDPFSVVGAPGFAIYGGFLVEHEKDVRLTGREKYRTYSNILANTTIVSSGVRFFLNLVSKAGWKVEPKDESEAAEEIAEAVSMVMESMLTPWHRFIRRAAMSRFYGFSIQEWTALELEDGTIGYLDIAPRPQITIERWDVSDEGEVLGVIQRSPQTQHEIYIPRGKMIYMKDDSISDNPEGVGLFRHLAKTAARLDRYEILEGWGFERDLRGTPVGRAPLTEIRKMINAKTLKSEDAKALTAPIETFLKNALKGKDTAIFLDSSPYRGSGEQQTPIPHPQWNVELMKGSTTSQPEMSKAIERVNREMARVLGVEHLLLGSTAVGSFALSQDKSQNFGLIVDSTLREIKETLERDFLDPLFELNGWDKKLKPTFAVDQIQYRDIEQITSALEQIAKAGATLMPDDPAINEVRDLLGLRHAPEMSPELMLQMQQPQPLPAGNNEEEV